MHRVLIADDDSFLISRFVATALSGLADFEIESALSPDQCRSKIKETSFDIVILDVRFCKYRDDRSGIDLIPEVKILQPHAEIIVLSGLDDRETIAACLLAGANGFTSKRHNSIPQIAARVRSAIERKRQRLEMTTSGAELAKRVGCAYVSSSMKQVFMKAAQAQREQRTHVLITGPTGSGKELVARAINSGLRPFVIVNAAALQDSLIESELFGHERGAFTGALQRTQGQFELADGGDLFIDELGCLSLKAQATLLRAVQSGEYIRVGGSKLQRAQVRIIAATNANLQAMVAHELFREDLHERLSGIEIHVPPLCERPEDIDPIIDAYLMKSKSECVGTMAPECRSFLRALPWSRNVRELLNVVSLARASAGDREIEIGDLPRSIFEKGVKSSNSDEESSVDFILQSPLGLSFDEFEKRAARAYIHKTVKNAPAKMTTRALAERLSIPKTNLLRKLNALGIDLHTLHNEV